jgi:cation diffusion facilitator family transporter
MSRTTTSADGTDPRALAERGMKAALTGLGVNVALVVVKMVAGVAGHSYALIADAVESSTDVFSSLIVWAGLRVTTRPADDDYPYGYGRAEALATAAVSLMLLGAALGIAVAAVGEIFTPHHAPSAFTLWVLAAVVVVKEGLSRRVLRVGDETGSKAVKADAWHHRSDALTSAAAFIGIAVALWGGPGWEAADDWAALAAAAVVAVNGGLLLRGSARDLMDRDPGGPLRERITAAAEAVEGVLDTEALMVRRLGTEYFVDLHVQADPAMSLHDAHVLSGKVKGSIRASVPTVTRVLIHMEPYEPAAGPARPLL